MGNYFSKCLKFDLLLSSILWGFVKGPTYTFSYVSYALFMRSITYDSLGSCKSSVKTAQYCMSPLTMLLSVGLCSFCLCYSNLANFLTTLASLIGGFQLEFVSISQVHMTYYKFEFSHWLKLQHSD